MHFKVDLLRLHPLRPDTSDRASPLLSYHCLTPYSFPSRSVSQ